MPTQARPESVLRQIVVRVQVGRHRMAATDDPLFLRLGGPAGREFRLALARGHALRRGQESVFVLAAPDAAETNVAHPELNDPAMPAIALASVDSVWLIKRLEPIPNVRGVAEMDDRLLIDEVVVELHGHDAARPVRFRREGPLWLGLVCGLEIALERTAAAP